MAKSKSNSRTGKRVRSRVRRRKSRHDVSSERVSELSKQLPFRDDVSWWSLPSRGGYVGGCDSGMAAAWAFMKFLRERQKVQPGSSGGYLQLIALAMLVGKKESSSRKGQAVGFFSTLDSYLNKLALIDDELDHFSFEMTRKKCAEGLRNIPDLVRMEQKGLLRGSRA